MHLLHQVTVFVLDLIQRLGYAGLFAGMLGQAVGVPLPSEVMLSFSGYLASTRVFALAAVIVAGAAGDLGGAVLAYLVGYHGGRPFLVRFGRLFFVRQTEIDRADRWFFRYGPRAVLICKLLPGIRALGSYPAGVTRMPIASFLGWTALGSLLWCTALAVLGYVLGQNWSRLSAVLRPFSALLLLAAVALIAFWIYAHFRAERKHEAAGP